MTRHIHCQIVGRSTLQTAIARGRKRNLWPDAIARILGNTQRWSTVWTGDELTGSAPSSEHDCRDYTGALCPKLAEALARQALAERQLIEFNHRAANVLQMLATRVEQQRRGQDARIAGGSFDELLASFQASARLHRCLLPARGHVQLDLAQSFGDLATAFESLTGLQALVEAESIAVPSQVAMHLAAAVNELAWNALKHAYHGKRGGVIQVVCRRAADSRLLLSVADAGRGLPPTFDPRASKGLGLSIVCATVKQFGGELRVESDKGVRFTMLLDGPRVERARA